MWVVIAVIAAAVLVPLAVFALEIVAIAKQWATRPSTLLQQLATLVGRFFFNLGYWAVALADLPRFMRLAWTHILTFVLRFVDEKVIREAVSNVLGATARLCLAGFQFFAGIGQSLANATIPWLTWPIFFLGIVPSMIAYEAAAIYVGFPVRTLPIVLALARGTHWYGAAMIDAIRNLDLTAYPRFLLNAIVGIVPDWVLDRMRHDLLAIGRYVILPAEVLRIAAGVVIAMIAIFLSLYCASTSRPERLDAAEAAADTSDAPAVRHRTRGSARAPILKDD